MSVKKNLRKYWYLSIPFTIINSMTSQENKEPDINGDDGIKIRNILEQAERTVLPAGSVVGKYRIVEEIDRGGMAVVYKAVQLDLNRTVALKVLPANITIHRRFVERFLSEAHAVAHLTHPYIVAIHEVSMENNVYFLAMDYISGKNLYHFLHHKKPKLVDVVTIVIRLADALAYAHGRRIIHRDLKLNNVIMKDATTPVLIDFGLAKAMEEEEHHLTRTGEIMGSPAYMAPERIGKGIADERSDICSLGIMLYELLTFKNPYLDPRSLHQTTLNVLDAAPVAPRKLIPWLPVECEAIVLKAMDKDPMRRYQSMTEFGNDLLRYQRGEPVLAAPLSRTSRVIRFFKKHRMAGVITGLIGLFCALIVSGIYIQSRKEQWRWQTVNLERFSNTGMVTDWLPCGGGHCDNRAHWDVANGELTVTGSAPSWIKYTRPFARDLRIEADVRSLSGSLSDVGIFLYGTVPDSGFRFVLYRQETGECGISLPGSRFLFYDYAPTSLKPDSVYHIIAERKGSVFSFTVNGILVGKVYNIEPPLGNSYQGFGFFAGDGGYAFDNVRISRRAMPLLAPSTIVADRLRETGDIQGAFAEYADLMLEKPKPQLVEELRIRCAEMQIRLGNIGDALSFLGPVPVRRPDTDDRISRWLYWRARAQQCRDDSAHADSLFALLSKRYPLCPAALSAGTSALRDAAQSVNPDSLHILEDRLLILSNRYVPLARFYGRVHVDILKYYVTAGTLDESLAVANRILSSYADPEIRTWASVLLARAYCGKRRTREALDLLNRATVKGVHSNATFNAWLTIAEVYAYESNPADARTIFEKIWQEGETGLSVTWMARLRMGELSAEQNDPDIANRIFTEVIAGKHPFKLPRYIAGYYINQIDEDSLSSCWRVFRGGDPGLLRYFAQKAIMNKNKDLAAEYLYDFSAGLSQESWEYVKAVGLIQTLDRQSAKEKIGE
jgi:serine/threonine protein kinase/tetratricopeptide (TPR) repeat protein